MTEHIHFDVSIVHCICLPFYGYDWSYFFCFIAESFVLCKTYCPPSQYVPSINAPVICVSDLSVVDHPPVPFKVCGSEVSYDSDTNYPLQVCDKYPIPLAYVGFECRKIIKKDEVLKLLCTGTSWM